jgi:hypothetical protein
MFTTGVEVRDFYIRELRKLRESSALVTADLDAFIETVLAWVCLIRRLLQEHGVMHGNDAVVCNL